MKKTIKSEFSELLLNSVNLIIVSTDDNGNINYISPAAEKIIGYKNSELIGNQWWNYTYSSTKEIDLFKIKLHKILNGSLEIDTKPYDRQLKCKDGSFKWIEWRDSIGIYNSYISVGVDITEWKRAEEKKLHSDIILESLISMILVRDIDGNVIFATPSVEKMLGYPLEQIMGDKWLKVTCKNKNEAENVSNAIHKYIFFDKKSSIDIHRQKIKTADGDFKWIEWEYSKGVNDSYISIGTDITKNILAEIELKNAKEFAEQSLKIKNQFLANMSHEIRTPLNAVIGFTDLLLESELTSEQKEQLETMRNSGEILLSLINNVLDLSKLESNKHTTEEIHFNLHERLDGIVKMMKLKANEKNISLNLVVDKKTPIQVVGDPTKLEQILLNLIGNAVKFTDEGVVTVSVKQIEESKDSSKVYFEIKDTGIGIISNKINTVFAAFTQAKSDTSRIFGGTGLGLTIVKKLVTLLEGNIEVESVFGEGSVFKITLPFIKGKIEDNTTEKQPKTLMNQPLNLSVLLVEDNKTNQLLAKTRLDRWKCKVDIANNGIEAVKKTQQKIYDVILMDIQMPVMDGYEATKIIKNDISERVSLIPIIAMTAYASNADIKKARNVGMDDYIFKPFKPDELYGLLKRYGNTSIDKEIEPKKVNRKIKNGAVKKYVDLKFIRDETLNESAIIKLLIESFITDFEEFLETINVELPNKNWEGLYQATHKIKPSVMMFGIDKMQPILHSLMTNLKEEKQFEDIGEHFDSCKDIFKHCKVELLAELKSLGNE